MCPCFAWEVEEREGSKIGVALLKFFSFNLDNVDNTFSTE